MTKPKEFFVNRRIGTGGDVLVELSEYQKPDNYYHTIEKSAFDMAVAALRECVLAMKKMESAFPDDDGLVIYRSIEVKTRAEDFLRQHVEPSEVK